MADIV